MASDVTRSDKRSVVTFGYFQDINLIPFKYVVIVISVNIFAHAGSVLMFLHKQISLERFR